MVLYTSLLNAQQYKVRIKGKVDKYITLYIRLIGQVGWVLAHSPEDLGSIPGRIIPRTLKMVLYTTLLNAQQYKVRIKGKVEQSREKISALHYTLV